jgi:WD40 repeat protein
MSSADLTDAHFIEMGEVFSIAFNLDGNLLASGGNDTNIRIWNINDINNITELKSITGHSSIVTALEFEKTHDLLLSGSKNEIIVFSLPNYSNEMEFKNTAGSPFFIDIDISEISNIIPIHIGNPSTIALGVMGSICLPDPNRLYSIPYYIGNLGPSCITTITHPTHNKGVIKKIHQGKHYNYKEYPCRALILSDSRYFMNHGQIGKFSFHDHDKKIEWEINIENKSCYCFNEDIIVFGDAVGNLEYYNLHSGLLFLTVNAHSSYITSLDIIDNKIIGSGSEDSTINFWDAHLWVDNKDKSHASTDQNSSSKEITSDPIINPEFGRCIGTIQLKMNCQGLIITENTKGLEVIITVLKTNLTMNRKHAEEITHISLAEWLIQRGANKTIQL